MAKRSGMRGSIAFLITFFIFLVLFGGVAFWGLSEYWQHTRPVPDEGSTTSTTETPTASKAHRLLLITENEGQAQGFVLLSAERAQGEIRVIPLPRETVVTVGRQETRLCDLYRDGDMGAVTAQVADLLGMPVEHYAVLSYRNLEKWISYLGDGVIYTLSEPISYASESGVTINMRADTHTLSAVQVTDLLSYQGWRTGERGRATVQGEIAAAIINQYFVASRFDETDADFHTMIDLVRSNVLTSDFINAREDLLALARRNQFDICRLRQPAGEFVGVEDTLRFLPAESPLS